MDRNEGIVRKFIQEAFNEGHVEAIDALTSPDFVEHQGVADRLAVLQQIEGAAPRVGG